MADDRFFVFFLEIWPQEFYFVTGLLILAALGLFLATSAVGRVWCGYTCPQTVWTDLFMRGRALLVEGDRNARIRLDKAPLGPGKIFKKGMTHAAWLPSPSPTGGALIFYFRDAPTLVGELFTGTAPAIAYLFLGLFTAHHLRARRHRARAGLHLHVPLAAHPGRHDRPGDAAGHLRGWRGEPRGPHKKGQSWEGRGDCVDCTACVAVCPTGIDIRDGSQLECIGCGLCIDACNEIMDKVGRPRGLIAYDTIAGQEAAAQGGTTPLPADAAAHAALRRPARRWSGRSCWSALLNRTDARDQRAARPQPALRAAVRRQHPQRLHGQDPQQAARGARVHAGAARPAGGEARHRRHGGGRHRSASPPTICASCACWSPCRRASLPGTRKARSHCSWSCATPHRGTRSRAPPSSRSPGGIHEPDRAAVAPAARGPAGPQRAVGLRRLLRRGLRRQRGDDLRRAVDPHRPVANEPYRKGLHYNERIAADARQAALGWTETVDVGRDGRVQSQRRGPGGAAVRGIGGERACSGGRPPSARTSR